MTTIFSGKTKEGLQIVVDKVFTDFQTTIKIKTGMWRLEDASLMEWGVYSNGTRWFIYSSPWHYKTNQNKDPKTREPVKVSPRAHDPLATLEIPTEGSGRVSYTSRMDTTHLIERQ